MGRLRSRLGCLTCRRRHVKCDETRPVCGQCAKSDRLCDIDPRSQQLRVKRYLGPQAKTNEAASDVEISQLQNPGASEEQLSTQSHDETSSPGGSYEIPPHSRPHSDHQDTELTPDVASLSSRRCVPGSIAISPNTVAGYQQLHETSPEQYCETYSIKPTYGLELSRSDAVYLHHFAQHLAVWLDCTDASRHFTLSMTTLSKASPILLNAVVSFAARHMKCGMTADSAQQRCVELLIPHLSCDEVGNDEAILCAIVILRVCEQLSAISTGGDQERHLSGLGALMKASQASFELDPSSPTLSQAAFWVFVRQALYNACVHQQPPSLDFNLIVLPPPSTNASFTTVKTETAWANTMTWICARVIRFCFGDTASLPGTEAREQRWLEMSRAVENWQNSKPGTFEPIWYSEPEHSGDNPFPEILFTSDWHVMAFGFYHLACMLLEIYQAAPRFATRRVLVGTQDADAKVMVHARALCGASKSSPTTVPSLITLCHSTFIWGPLMTDEREQTCVIKLLEEFELAHSWPTAWIVAALRKEWYKT